MNEESQKLNFEEAARLRDRMAALEHALEKQNVDWGGAKDQDVVGLFVQEDKYQICILFVREGKLLGIKSFAPIKLKTTAAEVVSSCLIQYYDGETNAPDEIIIPCHLPDEEVIIEWLTEKKSKKIALTVPVIGAKNALLEMANENARNLWEAAHKKEGQKSTALQILQEKLSLAKLPRRVECYDISNISGKNAVGSLAVFQDGDPDKSSYRRYRIETLAEQDDYGMMYEVLSRRFAQGENLPDLVVVDGGKGQLNVALLVLKDLKIKTDVIGLAKEDRTMTSAGNRIKKKTGKSEDRIYLPGRKDAIYLSAWPQALHILQQARDEAHRFALSYHHRIKLKDDLRSVLDDIADVGESRRKILLKHFASSEKIKEASIDELQEVPGIGKSLAEKIHSHLKNKNRK